MDVLQVGGFHCRNFNSQAWAMCMQVSRILEKFYQGKRVYWPTFYCCDVDDSQAWCGHWCISIAGTILEGPSLRTFTEAKQIPALGYVFQVSLKILEFDLMLGCWVYSKQDVTSKEIIKISIYKLQNDYVTSISTLVLIKSWEDWVRSCSSKVPTSYVLPITSSMETRRRDG